MSGGVGRGISLGGFDVVAAGAQATMNAVTAAPITDSAFIFSWDEMIASGMIETAG